MAQGRCLIAWRMENNGFVELENTSPGYLLQERKRLQARNAQP